MNKNKFLIYTRNFMLTIFGRHIKFSFFFLRFFSIFLTYVHFSLLKRVYVYTFSRKTHDNIFNVLFSVSYRITDNSPTPPPALFEMISLYIYSTENWRKKYLYTGSLLTVCQIISNFVYQQMYSRPYYTYIFSALSTRKHMKIMLQLYCSFLGP